MTIFDIAATLTGEGPVYLFTGSPEWWDADRAPRRHDRRFASVRPWKTASTAWITR
jgi:hypothetical protein